MAAVAAAAAAAEAARGEGGRLCCATHLWMVMDQASLIGSCSRPQLPRPATSQVKACGACAGKSTRTMKGTIRTGWLSARLLQRATPPEPKVGQI